MKKVFYIGVLFVVLIIVLTLMINSTFNNKESDVNYEDKISAILADKLEVEKKWIIDKNKIPYDLSKAKIYEIEQTYICFSPEIRVRKINNGEAYSFAVKTNMTSDGMIRDEMEEYITQSEYNNLVKKQEGNTIYKTRYQFLDGNNILAVDIFSGNLEGLAYLEIEFENSEDANNFQTPNWVIKDVTNDVNYKNGHLARYGIPDSFFEYIK